MTSDTLVISEVQSAKDSTLLYWRMGKNPAKIAFLQYFYKRIFVSACMKLILKNKFVQRCKFFTVYKLRI